MGKYRINADCFMGCHCDGEPEYEQGEAYVEFTDEQVDALVELIRRKGGETDVNALDLYNELPEIARTLDAACHDLACHTEFVHWAIAGFENGYFDEPDGLVERMKSEGLFEPELDPDDYEDEDEYEEAEREEFDEWIQGYFDFLPTDEDRLRFLETYYVEDLSSQIDSEISEYTVAIPEEIISMAKEP